MNPLPRHFAWRASDPLIAPRPHAGEMPYSIKDPTVVRHGGRWHLFCTVRSRTRTHAIEYLSFPSWEEADRAERGLLRCVDGYFCAPQVFFFRPWDRWVLVYQVHLEGRRLGLQPAYSTAANLADPNGWSPPTLFFPEKDPEGVERWIDFWVICDEDRAFLFFTSLDGRLWRMSARIGDFPHGFTNAEVVVTDAHPDWRLFEASHTYRLAGRDAYMTIVEAEDRTRRNRRFYLAYLAESLDGAWEPLAASLRNPFASADNVTFPSERWADSISHGELLRDGTDERLLVDPSRLRFLFQGVRDAEREGKPYGEIPWRLGLLTLS